jgi:hypothetical protein
MRKFRSETRRPASDPKPSPNLMTQATMSRSSPWAGCVALGRFWLARFTYRAEGLWAAYARDPYSVSIAYALQK